MSKILTKFCITVFLFSLLLTSSLFALSMEVLKDPNFIEPMYRNNANFVEPMRSTAQSNNVESNQYKSGDSAKYICSEIGFNSPAGSGSDCWGWVDGNGTEYAIYGAVNAIEFYNLETESFVGSIPAPTSTWHDIKTYQNYCYSVSEGTGINDGLSIIDMQYLPDSVHFIKAISIDNTGARTSHNLNIDTAKGYCYIEGTSASNNSVHILSLADPVNPSYIRSFGPGNGIHDFFCHNDTLYLAEGNNHTFSIWNMGNKNSPELLVRISIPNAGYVHNIWPTGDKRHILTTEETPNKTVKLWNIEDLNNIQLTDEYLAPSALAHNAHIVGDTAYLSHYESGVVMLDLSDENNIVEIGRYDTYPANESANFNGCWGVYPHTPSGRFYASNIEGQLYVLKEFNTVLADTLIAMDAQEVAGNSVRVDIWAKFTLPIHEFEIPFNWGGPLNLVYDSAVTTGLMTDYFEVKQVTAIDSWNKRIAYLIRASNSNTSPDLPSGEGVILSIYFTIPGGTTGGPNPITFAPFNTKEASFRNSCIYYSPDTLSGLVSLGVAPCCIDFRGNVDSSPGDAIDISDLVYLVDFMFTSGPAPTCFEEADITADTNIDISDLVYLVDFMFTNGPQPPACP